VVSTSVCWEEVTRIGVQERVREESRTKHQLYDLRKGEEREFRDVPWGSSSGGRQVCQCEKGRSASGYVARGAWAHSVKTDWTLARCA